jgi:hypothetical protein
MKPFQTNIQRKETIFYNDLQKALLSKTSNSYVTISLQANAQTSYDTDTHLEVLGRYSKGNKTNNNGSRLIEFAVEINSS